MGCTFDEEICYYIFEDASTWIVEFDSEDLSRPFATFEAARDAARQAAEARWLFTGKVSCVRVGNPAGTSEIDIRYG